MEFVLLILLSTLYAFAFLSGIFGKRRPAIYMIYVALVLHAGLLIFRSVSAGHPPVSGIYEALILLSWLMLLKFCFLQKGSSALAVHVQRAGVLLAVLAALLLPQEFRTAALPEPALGNFWMYVHFPAYLFAAVTLFSALVLSAIRLFRKAENFPHASRMERDVRLAALFLWIAVFTEAAGARLSGGNYGSGDLSQLWSVITLMILSLYFFTRSPGWRALVLFLGFLSMLFAGIGAEHFLGV